jgi:hypothetical protein
MILVEIPVYFETDETIKLEDLNIKSKLSDCDTKLVYFAKMFTGILSDYEDGINFTRFYIGGTSFSTPLSMKKVCDKFDEAYTKHELI